MAIAIKPIPTLSGKAALKFVEKADKTFKKKSASIDFREQVKIRETILQNSKLKK